MDVRTRIEMLGGLRIVQQDRVITRFKTQKTGALIAYLAYYGARPHARENLIELLWPETEAASGRNCLSLALSSLRHQLEPPGAPHGALLRADRTAIQLNPEAVETDVAEFDTLRQQAMKSVSTQQRRLLLADAVELYRGELLPGYYEEWCLAERERLLADYLGTLHHLVGLLGASGDLECALGYARRAVSADALQEEGHRDVMQLLAAAGQPTAALRQYRELERMLQEQLGEEPSAATRELARQIERQSMSLPHGKSGSLKKPAAAPRRSSPLAARMPTGTVTFLLTDIERSTAQWESGGDAFTTALASHHLLLRQLFHRFAGYEVKEVGDGFIVAFGRALDAVACAVAGQQALSDHPWPAGRGMLRVRMALHTGDVELQAGDYHGRVLHYASRLLATAHGGQILCSPPTAALVQRSLEPGWRLTNLGVYRLRDIETSEFLFQVEHPSMVQPVFPPLLAEAGYARALPLQFTRFVGRERELRDLQSLLLDEQTRLATLTGPGGTGKSRLALELANRLVEPFQGAVWFVRLEDLPEARMILDAVREALRLPRSPDIEPLEQVVEMLGRQPSVLLLDNFEHLVEEGAPAVQALLEGVSSVKCLVTSRQRLNLAAEREFAVPPLQTPRERNTAERLATYESVQLFVDRAQSVKPDFQVTDQNAADLAELCNRLEGMPLAIELAAARAQVLTPAQMLRQLSHRFEFLVGRRRGGAQRHQTLRASIDWSYRLLPLELQRFFARLSVFRGGWTLEAAEAVCSEPMALDYLAQLQECSLILAEETVPLTARPAAATGGAMRYRMLETLREFGQECLDSSGELTSACRRHAAWSLELVERAEPELWGPHQAAWLDLLQGEHDNFRAALEWSHTEAGEWEIGLQLAGGLWRFWLLRGHWQEGREWLSSLLADSEAAPPAGSSEAWRAKALCACGDLARRQAEYDQATALLEASLALFRQQRDSTGMAWSLNRLAVVKWRRGEMARAASLIEESLGLSRQLGDKRGTAYSLYVFGCVAWRQAEYARAETLLEDSLALFRELEDTTGITWALNRLGAVAGRRGEPERAVALVEQSLALAREMGNRMFIPTALNSLGEIARSQGNYDRAAEWHRESLALWRELGGKAGVVECLECLGRVADAQGRRERAARLSGAAAALRSTISATYSPPVEMDPESYDPSHLSLPPDEACAAAWEEGRSMALDRAIAYALARDDNEPTPL